MKNFQEEVNLQVIWIRYHVVPIIIMCQQDPELIELLFEFWLLTRKMMCITFNLIVDEKNLSEKVGTRTTCLVLR